jgi:hypothetical protein
MGDYLSTDPKAGEYLSSDPRAGTPVRRPITLMGAGAGVGPEPPDLRAGDRFVRALAETVNPVEVARGIGAVIDDPDAAIVDPMRAAAAKGGAAWDEGRYSEALGYGTASVIPMAGPAAVGAAERIGSGDVAGGLGEMTGLLLPVAAPAAVRGTIRRAGRTVPGAAEMLEQRAAANVTDVLAPKVGPNKMRFGNLSARVAPKLARDLANEGRAPLTRTGFRDFVSRRLSESVQALDEASDARLSNQVFDVGDLVKALEERRATLTAQNVTLQTSSKGPTAPGIPSGKPVVPGPNSVRVAVIDQAIEELRSLGGLQGKVGYEPIRTLRKAYDGPAQTVYNPSMTADFLKNKGASLGAADVTGVLREHLAKWDPETARANAQYSVYKGADDVLSAVEEVERVRPKVGRQIATRVFGAVLGAETAGAGGAVAGYVSAPAFEAIASSGITTKLKWAAFQQRLARSIRTGDVGRSISIASQMKRLAQVEAISSGHRLPDMQTAPATR